MYCRQLIRDAIAMLTEVCDEFDLCCSWLMHLLGMVNGYTLPPRNVLAHGACSNTRCKRSSRYFCCRGIRRNVHINSCQDSASKLIGRMIELFHRYFQDKLHFKYKIEVPAKCVQGRLYLRISACVYNEHREYETLRDAILDIASSSSCE